MSRKVDELVDEARAVAKELRALSNRKLSITGWVSSCLKRGGLEYADIEDAKSRLGGDFLRTRMVDSGAYVKDVRKNASQTNR